MGKRNKLPRTGIISEFQVKGLHGRARPINVRLADNTLILVGENGAGKTTILNMLYYLLSGQWNAIVRYRFEELAITLDGKSHALRYTDFEQSPPDIDTRFLQRLPPHTRRRLIHLAQLVRESHGDILTDELEMLCHRYDVPLPLMLQDWVTPMERPSNSQKKLSNMLENIRAHLTAQLLYLPTYRRIEQELHLIFQDIDERDLRRRRERFGGRKGKFSVELVEFGMQDVAGAIEATLRELTNFARDNLNKLTFGYLGDIVEAQYATVELKSIRQLSEANIDNVLNRIQEHILSSAMKAELKRIIQRANVIGELDEHAKIICHYFAKLMQFQQDLETRETQLESFCSVCNEYMPTKQFVYDNASFTFTIRPRNALRSGDEDSNKIELRHLSSGEKQIVSLFSHLYLSGGREFFVLIDEPELSLSVPWQRRFLADIRHSAFCTGLVAVTHSPFIYDNDLCQYAHGLGEFEGELA